MALTPGPAAVNAVDNLTLASPETSSYSLRYKGSQTDMLPYNASGADIKAALEALVDLPDLDEEAAIAAYAQMEQRKYDTDKNRCTVS